MATFTYSIQMHTAIDQAVAASTSVGDGLSNFTTSVWFKTSAGDGALFAKGASATTPGWRARMSGGAVEFALTTDGSNDAFWVSFGSYQDNAWHNLTVVVTGGNNAGLYVDGSLIIPFHGTDGTLTTYGNSDPMTIGTLAPSGGSADQFVGFICQPQIWDVALSAGEVATIASGGDFGIPIGYWKMTEGSGTTIADSSTNANTMTLDAGPTWSSDVPTFPSDSKKKASMFLVA